MEDDETNIAKVVARSYLNRREIENSEECGCFHCLTIFSPSAITLWTDSEDPRDEDPGRLRPDSKGFNAFNGNTAICPTCEYDSVIGSASGYPISEESLRRLRAHWHRSEFSDD